MKPFDLEAAKRGEPVFDRDDDEVNFIGVRNNGQIVIETKGGWLTSEHSHYLFMAPKKRTVWVNLYSNKEALYHETEEKADEHQRRSENRIGGRAYPVEVEE